MLTFDGQFSDKEVGLLSIIKFGSLNPKGVSDLYC